MKTNALCRIEALLMYPYWVIDILPRRVPAARGAAYEAFERYCRQSPVRRSICVRHLGLWMKLQCYYDLTVIAYDGERESPELPPEAWPALMVRPRGRMCALIASEDALITRDMDDTYATVYNPSERLLKDMRALASAEGLFLWPDGDTVEA